MQLENNEKVCFNNIYLRKLKLKNMNFVYNV